jgi:lipoate-protein ligase A
MCVLTTTKGKISATRFYGDYFGPKDISYLEEKLLNQPFIDEAIKEVLQDINVSDYIFRFNNKHLLSFLL